MTHQSRSCRGAGIVPPVVMAAVCILVFMAGAAEGSYGYPYQTRRVWPAVPTQRAMIIHRDGVEQLVLEAAAPGEGSFGWIVPVPALPTRVQGASPGLLKTIAIQTQPELTGDVHFTGTKWLAGLVTAWGVLLLLPTKTRGRAFGRLVVVLLIGGTVAVVVMLPYIGHVGARPSWPRIPQHATDAAGLCVVAMQPAGLAGPVVVQPDSTEEFDHWLVERGFAPVPQQAREDVFACIQRRWHFVVTRVQAQEDGRCSPPAVSIEFAAGEPMYPPRLGRLAGSQAALELAVLADRQVEVDGLTTEVADRLQQIEETRTLGQPVQTYFRTEPYPYEVQIRHSQTGQAMWSGCWLTRLYGPIGAGLSAGEMAVRRGPSQPYRLHVYTPEGALLTGWAWALMLWSAALPAGVLACYGRPGRRGLWLARLGVVVPLVACLVVLAGAYMLLPRMPAELRWAFTGNPEWVHRGLLADVQAIHGPMGRMSLAEVREILADHYRYTIVPNGFTMGSICEEESPGNYTLQETEAKDLVLRWHWTSGTSDVLIHRGPDELLVLDQPPEENPLLSKPPAAFGATRPPISDLQALAMVRADVLDYGRPLYDLPSEVRRDVERLARQTRTAMPADRGDPLQARQFLDRIERRLRAQDR